jgi:ADP-ribosyl-[dinitrogen reductase] hydrolase
MTPGQQDRATGAFVGLAVGDALGAPVEFKRRGSFPIVTDMLGGGYFGLPKGSWTDDTAQALCLAHSLQHAPEFEPGDFLDRIWRWMERGENSATGTPVGIGQNTLRVMGHYRRTGVLVAPPIAGKSDGNGALMRLAPVACVHWRHPAEARRIAVSQSRATHRSDLSAGGCEALAALLSALIAGDPWEDAIKLQTDDAWPEPIRAISGGEWRGKVIDEIHSTGFVVHTLEAAIWCADTTNSFETALIQAVNLGDDADTVGAVAGQIAGARYGLSAIPDRWLQSLALSQDIQEVADLLLSIRD